MEKTTIKIYGNPFFAGGNYRLPNEDGTPSPYSMDQEWVEAHAFDEEGTEYLILWDLNPDWDGMDSGTAFDYDNPVAILVYGKNGKTFDVSSKVIIEE